MFRMCIPTKLKKLVSAQLEGRPAVNCACSLVQHQKKKKKNGLGFVCEEGDKLFINSPYHTSFYSSEKLKVHRSWDLLRSPDLR